MKTLMLTLQAIDPKAWMFFLAAMVLFPALGFVFGRGQNAQGKSEMFAKIAKFITIGLSIVGVIFFIIIAKNNTVLTDENEMNSDAYKSAAGIIGLAVNMSLYAIFVAFGLLTGYGLLKIIENPKGNITLLITFGLFFAILIGSWFYGAVEASELNAQFIAEEAAKYVTPSLAEADPNYVSEAKSLEMANGFWKDGGGSIMAALVFSGLTVLVIAYAEINKLFK